MTTWLPEHLLAAMSDVVGGGTVVDGELVLLTEKPDGPCADFAGLSSRLLGRGRSQTAGLHLVLYDILEVDGEDVRPRPLDERRAVLQQHLADRIGPGSPVSLITTLPLTQAAHDQVVRLGYEGTVAKLRTSTYRAGRSSSWRKIKARHRLAGSVVRVTEKDGQRRALVALDEGGLSWALARGGCSPDQRVAVIFSRRDANGGRERPVWVHSSPPIHITLPASRPGRPPRFEGAKADGAARGGSGEARA